MILLPGRARGAQPRGSNIDHQSELGSAAELKYLASDIKSTDLCTAAMLDAAGPNWCGAPLLYRAMGTDAGSYRLRVRCSGTSGRNVFMGGT